MHRESKKRGFTLVEVLVGTAMFLIVATAFYGAIAGLFRLINLAQYQELAIDVANEQMEIIRNMPYTDVGIQGSIPNGNIPYQQTVTRGGIPFLVTAIVRNIDLPADGVAGGTPNDTNPADNKLVSLTVSCNTCANTQPLTITGQVAPLALENTGNTGSIFIHVHDASGAPIQGANVTVTNTSASLTVHDVTDDTGTLALVGVPPGVNAYHIVVTKTGYSTDQTYPLGPGVTNPDSNVSTGQVTDVYFFIDKVSSFIITSVSPTCVVIPGYHFHLTSSKQVGTNAPKYSQDQQTNGSGILNLSPLEWDTAGYILTPIDTTYDLAGINPVNPVVLNPGTAINLQLVTVPHGPDSLMVSVVGNSGLPIPNASVTLEDSGSNPISTEVTGQGSISQTDWSGGSGQINYNPGTNMYYTATNADDSGGDIKLFSGGFGYPSNATLESSTFDTGTTSNFYNLVWQPGGQSSASTSVKFQFAASASSSPTGGWDSLFTGPDGTNGTFYTNANSSISTYNGSRYARYLVYLDSVDPNYTPDISDVSFTYTSACIPPGQVIFQGLSAGSYKISISAAGYQSVTDDPVTVTSSPNWTEKDEVMHP